MAPSKPSQTLGKREASLFKDLMKYYETKSYKKGLKAADQILKKNGDHGETLAMRGLVLNCMDKKVRGADREERSDDALRTYLLAPF